MPLPIIAIVASFAFNMIAGPTVAIASERLRQLAAGQFPIELIPQQVLITLRYRKLIPDETYFSQMAQHGLSEDRAEAIFLASAFFPTPQDLVSWQAKEVFEPRSIEKFGLGQEFEDLDLSLFSKAGVDREQARNFWIAHWQHPSLGQIIEMLRKDVLAKVLEGRATEIGSDAWRSQRQEAEQLVFEWFRLVEIPPFWRDRLRLASLQPITRVDARRMWDLGVLNDEGVLRAYLDQGYELNLAEDLLLFAKVERRLPDLIALYRNQHINFAELREQTIALGLPEEKADFLLATKVANLDAPLRVIRERDLTKAEIVKGAKKGKITPAEAVELLEDMGYDRFEAIFIIEINIESEGSPETFSDFKALTQGLRSAEGQKFIRVPDSLRKAEHRLLAAQQAVTAAEEQKKPPANLPDLKVEVVRAKAALSGERQKFDRDKLATRSS